MDSKKNHQQVLEKKLESINNQLIGNGVLGIIAVLVLIFVPWIKFENWRFEISLEVIIALIVLVVCIVRGFSIRGKKEEIEIELSVYSKKEVKEEEKDVTNTPAKLKLVELICEYCDKKFDSDEGLNRHYDICKEKKYRAEKDKKICIWVVSIIIFVGISIYFLINNPINLVPLFLIGFSLTPFFDKLFNHYKKRINKIKHFEFNLWKKAVLILIIILVFILINLIIPECPASCSDNNPCTNDFCNKDTGYRCMNTIKLNCNGNKICESGEYGTSDCPNCNDRKKCTADSYDIGAKKCINVEMKGCVQ